MSRIPTAYQLETHKTTPLQRRSVPTAHSSVHTPLFHQLFSPTYLFSPIPPPQYRSQTLLLHSYTLFMQDFFQNTPAACVLPSSKRALYLISLPTTLHHHIHLRTPQPLPFSKALLSYFQHPPPHPKILLQNLNRLPQKHTTSPATPAKLTDTPTTFQTRLTCATSS